MATSLKLKTPTQLERVKGYVSIHGPAGITLAGAAQDLGLSQTGVSARLRDLRLEGYDVKTKITRDGNGNKRVTYVVSQFAVREARKPEGRKVVGVTKDVSEAALRKVAEQALNAGGNSTHTLGGRNDIIVGIAKYLAA